EDHASAVAGSKRERNAACLKLPGDRQAVFGTQVDVQQGESELALWQSAERPQHIFGIDGDEEVVLDQQAGVQEGSQQLMVALERLIGSVSLGALLFDGHAM